MCYNIAIDGVFIMKSLQERAYLCLTAATAIFLLGGQAHAALDTDGDGLADEAEVSVYYTDPHDADTDGDGYDDGLEMIHGYSPILGKGAQLLKTDTDGDGLNDGWEFAVMTDIKNPDTDGDGILDGVEVMEGYDPLTSEERRPEKRIEVDVSEARLTYYFNNRLLESFLISPGKSWTPTPRGQFSVMQKLPVARYKGPGYDYPNTKWNLLFTRQTYGYYIHGAYWHSRWGHGVSGGCVNVPYERMDRLYEWAEVDTKVIVTD